ncbi:hypothetical protein COY27_05085 [Candidatus Woesearchaeota archaeon CG_4_10_14_0_2_um_filter_33_13]|nr:MAG: hypothetical protein COY27_05085 [Candidatus Woesearchaeota archaeon CG_4_10_14_0_2_um_filter_33_13]
MKITIDTKEDSHEDIQKVMEILSHFTNKTGLNNEIRTNVQEVSKPDAETNNTGFMSMFGDNLDTTVTEKNKVPDTPPDFSSFLNLANKQEDKKELKPRIQFF